MGDECAICTQNLNNRTPIIGGSKIECPTCGIYPVYTYDYPLPFGAVKTFEKCIII